MAAVCRLVLSCGKPPDSGTFRPYQPATAALVYEHITHIPARVARLLARRWCVVPISPGTGVVSNASACGIQLLTCIAPAPTGYCLGGRRGGWCRSRPVGVGGERAGGFVDALDELVTAAVRRAPSGVRRRCACPVTPARRCRSSL